MDRPPTLRDLAKIAGVSHQTVALAIRNSPMVAKETRKRLQLIAKNAGYRHNPSLSTWVTYVRTKKPPAGRTALAFIAPLPLNSASKYEFYSEFYKGAHSEADYLGYSIDFFSLTDYNQNWNQIRKVLKARNIRGCLLFSQFLGGEIEMELNDFAVVCLDRARGPRQLDFVAADHYKGMTLALENLRRLGYKRIGYYGGLNHNVEDHSRWRGAFEADLLHRVRNDRIPMRELEIESPPPQHIVQWWKKYKPDAIISSFGHELGILQRAGVRIPKDVAMVQLDVHQNEKVMSGIDQQLPWVAGAGVRLLAEKLERNEVGPPKVCRGITIQPIWKDGKTAPPRKA